MSCACSTLCRAVWRTAKVLGRCTLQPRRARIAGEGEAELFCSVSGAGTGALCQAVGEGHQYCQRTVGGCSVSGQWRVMLPLPLKLRGGYVAVQDSLLESLFETLLAKVLCIEGSGRLAVAFWLHEVRYPPSDFGALSFSWRVRKLPAKPCPQSSRKRARARARAFLGGHCPVWRLRHWWAQCLPGLFVC